MVQIKKTLQGVIRTNPGRGVEVGTHFRLRCRRLKNNCRVWEEASFRPGIVPPAGVPRIDTSCGVRYCPTEDKHSSVEQEDSGRRRITTEPVEDNGR